MKRYTFILIALMATLTLGAGIHENAGEYGYQFLDIPISPLNMAMAGRGVHSPLSNASWILQPAVSCMQNGKSAAAAHSVWIGETAYTTAWYSNANRKSHMGLALRNLNYGDIEKRDETGYLLGYYQPVDIAVSGNYARRINPTLYAGMNLSVVYQKLDTASSLGLATDFGLTALPPLKDTMISFAIRNLGISNKTDEEAIDLPLSVDLDFYKGIPLGNEMMGLEAGIQKSVDEDLQYTMAMELSLLTLLRLRGGYKFNHDSQSFSAGLGVQLSRFGIDYGFAAFDEGLEDVHSFGLRYNF